MGGGLTKPIPLYCVLTEGDPFLGHWALFYAGFFFELFNDKGKTIRRISQPDLRRLNKVQKLANVEAKSLFALVDYCDEYIRQNPIYSIPRGAHCQDFCMAVASKMGVWTRWGGSLVASGFYSMTEEEWENGPSLYDSYFENRRYFIHEFLKQPKEDVPQLQPQQQPQQQPLQQPQQPQQQAPQQDPYISLSTEETQNLILLGQEITTLLLAEINDFDTAYKDAMAQTQNLLHVLKVPSNHPLYDATLKPKILRQLSLTYFRTHIRLYYFGQALCFLNTHRANPEKLQLLENLIISCHDAQIDFESLMEVPMTFTDYFEFWKRTYKNNLS